MDRASCVLAEGVPVGVPHSYRALADHGGVPRSTLYYRSSGRPSLQSKAQRQQYLTPAEEQAVVNFILQMSALGYPVRIKYFPEIALCAARSRPASHWPTKAPSKNWASALQKRHPELQARKVGALDWKRHDKNIDEKISAFFVDIEDVLHRPDILPRNIYNMDETGVMMSMLGSIKVLLGKDDMRTYRGAQVKRTLVTAIECISADGRSLLPMIIWPGTTHLSDWTTFPTPGWHYACSESGYTDSHISLEWMQRVFDPQTRERASGLPRLLICDGFGTHETLEILEHCFANNIILCRLPSHTSHMLQPCDILIFGPLKATYRDEVERLERGGGGTIGKQHFTALYSAARRLAFSENNILAGRGKAGLVPFNRGRVVSVLPGPANKQPVTGVLRDILSVDSSIPRTPLTPVSMQSLTSLQNTIIQKDACMLDKTSKQNLGRHLQKITKAAGTFYTTNTLQQEQIQSLWKVNNEAKVRRAAKSIVLGKGRVMSYDDLVAARVKRAEKDAARDHKDKISGQRRKRKGGAINRSLAVDPASTLQHGEGDVGPDLTRSEPLVENAEGFDHFRAPEARMY